MAQLNPRRALAVATAAVFITIAGGALAAENLNPKPEIGPATSCAGKPAGSACWMKLANRPGCHVWTHDLAENETAMWTGGCSSGLAEGTGTLTWVFGKNREREIKGEGRCIGGMRDGRWVVIHDNGRADEGPYVNGRRSGRWVLNIEDGGVAKGPYADGEMNGIWFLRSPQGHVLVSCHACIVASACLPWFVARRVPPAMVPPIAQGRNAATGQGRRALRERA